MERRPFRVDDEVGNHRYQAVEEELAGDEQRGVALHGGYHQQAVARPREAGSKGECVACGREMEHETAVQFDDDYADNSQQTSRYLYAPQPLFAIEQGDEQGSKQRAEADDECRVGRRRVVHGGIFRQEVERAACQSESEHDEFVLPAFGEPTERTPKGSKAQEKRIGDDEPQREYHSWRESRQQQEFRDDKR